MITVRQNSLFPKRRDGQIASSNSTTIINGGAGSAGGLQGVEWSGTTLIIKGSVYVSGDTKSYGDVMAFSSADAPLNWWDSMPVATSDVLGGVKVGSGLGINSTTGVLSVTGGTLTYNNNASTYLNGCGQWATITGGASQWVNTTGGIYYNSGCVAIGSTSTDGRTFKVTGNMTVTQGAIINDIKVNRSTGGANYPSYPDIYATTGGIVIGGLSNGTGTVSFATTGSATLPSMHIDTSGTVKINSGNLIFENNQAEKFIRGSKNGGAIRLRSDVACWVDRGIQLGQVDNNGTWVYTYLDLRETGHAVTGNLSVNNSTASGTLNDVFTINQNNSGGNPAIPSYYGGLKFTGNGYDWGAIRTIQTNPSGSWSNRMAFYTMNGAGGALAERMSINNDGNISTTGSYLSFDGAGLLAPPAGLNYGLFPHSGVGLGLFSYANKISFWGGGASPTEYMRVANGNLLLGTTSNAALAGVTGQVIYHSSSPGISLQNNSGYYLQYMVGTELRWYNGADRMFLSSTGNLSTTGEVTAYSSSDARLKQNIKPLKSGLELIHQLQPVTYNWNAKAVELNDKKDTCTNNFGLVAQEVEKVAPELVHSIYDCYKSVDYVQLVPVLIQAVKEQQKQIQCLQNDLNYFMNSSR